jgi:anti-sigma regulatory factor (Ser/Thr protein kinase)
VTADSFFLEIPAVAVYLGTARSFSSQIAQYAGLDEVTVEDVKLAVSEACAGSVGPAGSDGRVVVRSSLEPSLVAFEVDGTGDFAAHVSQEGPARIDLIKTLFPDTRFARHDGRTMVRFTLPLGG